MAGAAVEARIVRQPAATEAVGHYTPNRAPLAPTVFMKLPLGSIAPRGWLRHQLELDAAGIPGRLDDISRFLQFDNCGWVKPEKRGGEELAYWLRGYVSLAYTLHDDRLIANAGRWIEAILATRQPDGYFGPDSLRNAEKGKAESYPHECIVYTMRGYYEATGDRRALDAMAGSPDSSLTIAASPLADGRTQVIVADNGPGLAPEIRQRLFQPFTTSKADGMGMGLSICRSIILAHGGEISAEDNPAGGAVFRFTLIREAVADSNRPDH